VVNLRQAKADLAIDTNDTNVIVLIKSVMNIDVVVVIAMNPQYHRLQNHLIKDHARDQDQYQHHRADHATTSGVEVEMVEAADVQDHTIQDHAVVVITIDPILQISDEKIHRKLFYFFLF
jgi:hypothetical protein